MKIGIVGPNPGNNAYSWAKLLQRKGFEVIQFADSFYITDQPIWAESKIELPINHEFNRGFFAKQGLKKLQHFEKEHEWKNPIWFNRFQEMSPDITDFKIRNASLFLGKYKTEIFKYLRTNFSTKYILVSYFKLSKIIKEIENCDVVISQGWSMMVPYLTGVPYIVMPYGTELYDADKRRDYIDPLRAAYKVCSISATYQDYLSKYELKNGVPFHIPVDTSIYEPLTVEHNSFTFQEKFEKKYVFFMPARIHFEYKGTDKVIKAFSILAKQYSDALLVLLDWGDNKTEARNLIKELGIIENVIILDYWFSEKSLNMLYNLSSVILDNFPSGTLKLGTLSSIGRSASLVGKPLIMTYIHEANDFLANEIPPIISANTTEEIKKSMQFCLENRKEAERIGKKMREWSLKYHGDNAVVELINLLNDAIP